MSKLHLSPPPPVAGGGSVVVDSLFSRVLIVCGDFVFGHCFVI